MSFSADPNYHKPSSNFNIDGGGFGRSFPIIDKGGGIDGNSFNLNKAVNYLNTNSHSTFSEAKAAGDCSRCAYFVRMALEAGGINTTDHPVPARLYGSYLKKWGFSNINSTNYKSGDIVVIQGYPGGTSDKNGVPYGHIQMYNGIRWQSNFKQTFFWPGKGYKDNTPKFNVYRWQGHR